MRGGILRTLVSVGVLFTSSGTLAQSTEPPERVKAVGRQLAADWSAITGAVRDSAKTHDERSGAIDQFFAHLTETVERNGDEVVDYMLDKMRTAHHERADKAEAEEVDLADVREKLPELVSTLKTWLRQGSDKVVEALEKNDGAPDDATDKVKSLTARLSTFIDDASGKIDEALDKNAEKLDEAAEASARDEAKRFEKIERFVDRARTEHQLIPRTELAIRLTRDILRLQEQKVFALLDGKADAQRRIAVGAEMSRDMIFVARQARALVRLTVKSAEIAGHVIKHVSPDGDERGFKRMMQEDLAEPLSRLYPVLIEAANDLGVYYAKVLQTFSGLLYHLDRDAYDRLDYLQGRLPKTISFQEVKEIVEGDLGRSLDDAFLTFEREPFANGSIAQVHRATVASRRGPRAVAVKVQKSYVREELAWNQRTNDVLFKLIEIMAPAEAKPVLRFVTSQARELGATFEGELDFTAERARQHEFARILRPQRKSISVPKTFPRHSGPRVLTTELVPDARYVHQVFTAPTWTMPEVAEPPKAEPTATTTSTEGSSVKTDTPNATTVAPEPKLSLGLVFLKLSTEYGYRWNPRYFQFLRAAVPFASVSTHLVRTLHALSEAGKTKDDPEVMAVSKLLNGLMSSFFAQVIYAGEVNADLNWSNLLVDPQNHVHLIDWGSTVKTRGLLGSPVVLAGAVIQGNAALVVRRLTELGRFRDLGRDREAITALVQAYLDQEGWAKRSYYGAFKTYGLSSSSFKFSGSRKKKAAPADAAPAEKVAPADDAAAAPAVAQSTSASAEPAPPTSTEVKPNRPAALKVVARAIMPMAKVLIKYPYHRTRVRLIRATRGFDAWCESKLGRD